jgi:hypothetical protein
LREVIMGALVLMGPALRARFLLSMIKSGDL